MSLLAKKVTLKDIAKQAGISASLASRALANKYGVSQSVKDRVQLLAKEMGYDAGTVFSQKVLLMLDRETLFDSSFYGKIVSAADRRLIQNRLSLEIAVVQQLYTPEEIDELFLAKNPVGIIFLGKIEEQLISEVGKKGLPIVLVDNYSYIGQQFDMVRTNNYCCGYDATEYIISVGHRKIAFVGDIACSVSFKERHRGFEDAVLANRAEGVYVGGLSAEAPYCFDIGRFTEIFSADQYPDAIVCANDPTARFVINQLSSFGLSIPEKVSIIGCDNALPMLANGLTTMDVCTEEMGHSAVLLLLDRMQNPSKNSRYIQVGSKIIKRNSVYEFPR